MLKSLRSCAVILSSLLSAGVQAQPHGAPWDAGDPTNIADKQQWLALAWNESRTPAQEAEFQAFQFTNPFPDHGLTLVYDDLVIFANLYEDRLNPFGISGPVYTILDLLRDDQAVSDKFKIFATTGELITGLDDQTGVLNKHLEMVLDAVGGGGVYKFEDVNVIDGAVVSYKLGIKPFVATVNPPVVPVTPDPLKQFECDLKHWIKKSLLACMASRPGHQLYVPENDIVRQPNAHPRFDCDDFTDALLWFLKKRLLKIYPDAEVGGFAFWWYCSEVDATGQPVLKPDGTPKRTQPGHAIVYIKKDGKYWLVEPQTGELIGPFDNLKDLYDQAYAKWASCNCKAPIICKLEPSPHETTPGAPGPVTWPNPTIYKPGERHPADPQKPGLEFDDMQRRFCEFLQWACANCNVTPPAGCTPASLPPDVDPDPCTSLRPYTKPGTVIPSTNPCFFQ